LRASNGHAFSLFAERERRPGLCVVNSGFEKETRTIHFCARGRVQGVGFRAFVESEAYQLAIEGWVRNRRDGTVEGALKGRTNDVATLVERLQQGPPGALVTSIEIQDVEDGDDTARGFSIRPTV
jgi:acylphosphatase